MTTKSKVKEATAARTKAGKKKPGLVLSVDTVQPFAGFKYTVEEGKKLSRRSRTELPEFSKLAREK